VCPILFHVGPLAVHSYGVMLMLGFLAGLALSRRQARRVGLSPDVALDLGVWILLASIVLARLLYVGLNWREYFAHPLDILGVWREGGLSYFGGLLGGILAGLIYTRRTHLPFWLLGDVFAPGIALGYAITRVGCFLNGCCYGTPTSLPWGVVFPGITTLPSHPTQLYSAAGSLLLTGLLLWLHPRLKAQGQLFAAYLMLYGVLRGIVEIFRLGVSAEELVLGRHHLLLTQAQFVCVLLLVFGALLFLRLGRRGAPNPLRAAPRKAR